MAHGGQLLDLPMTLGPYKLLSPLGEGGMGAVYRASHATPAGEREVAVKVLHPLIVDDSQAVTMFLDEARLSMRVSSPNFVRVHDFGIDGGIPYMVMELLHGLTLERAMWTLGGPIPERLAAYVTHEILQALHHIHTLSEDGRPLGIVHRDIAPQNVFITSEGRVKLMDLGIAHYAGRRKLTARRAVRGRLRYLAPERARTGVESVQTDIYAVGLVLWEMVTGRPRYDEDSPDVFTDVAMGGYVPPSRHGIRVDKGLEAILRKALAPSPSERWGSAREMADAIAAWLGIKELHDGMRALGTLASGDKRLEDSIPTHLLAPGRTGLWGGYVDPARTLILEENVLTRIMSDEELMRVRARYSDTREFEVVEVRHGFARGVVAGMALSGALAALGYVLHLLLA